MKKLAAVFVIAVLVPAVALAWLATRSVRDQELIVHSQRALLHQGATDSLADELNFFLDDVRIFYGDLLEQLIAENGADNLASDFDVIIRSRWSQAELGAVVSEGGEWLNPPLTSHDPEVQDFLGNTRPFLLNAAPSDFYIAPATIANNVVTVEPEKSSWQMLQRKKAPQDYEIADDRVLQEGALEAAENLAMQSDEMARAQAAAEPARASAPATLPAPSSAPAAPASSARTAAVEAEPTAEATAPKEKQAVTFTAPFASAPQQKVAVKKAESYAFADSEIAADEVPPLAVALEQESMVEEVRSVGRSASKETLELAEDVLQQRARNVQPLGQLSQQIEGKSGNFSRFAKAATDALKDNPNRLAWSTLDLNRGELRDRIAGQPEGALSRFVSGGLQVLLWRRDPSAPGKIFWVELDLEEVRQDLSKLVRETTTNARRKSPEICLALLDSTGEVVAQSLPDFTADWRQPFVATEVGEILPHWEVAAYLVDPTAVTQSARDARMLLWMLIPFLLVAIGIGGFLIMREIGREMRLARQKTDFVSNVSHELKTPLTSIRMFSDLLGNRRELEDEKRLEYSGIISRESARLSRLINNLLDFSRMERGEKRYQREPIALREFLTDSLETCRHQIESDGFQLRIDCPEADGEPATVIGDRDALSQVLLNLLSNAEKYGGDAREIEVTLRCVDATAEIAVLDRGPGIPRKQAEKIFEKFYRVDDSLASGIEGSGLGLTLARQIARAHDGDLVYTPRSGGGSRFVLTLPLVAA